MSEFWERAAFALLLVAAAGTVVLVVRDAVTRRASTHVLVVGCAATLVILVGLGLTLAPVTASTGATCEMQPTTVVLGPMGAQERVDEAAPGTDKTSVRSCIDTARTRTVGASVCVVLAAGGYVLARRAGRDRTRTSRT